MRFTEASIRRLQKIIRPKTQPEIEAAMKARDIVNNSFLLDKRNARQVQLARMIHTKTGYRITTLTKMLGQKVRRHVVDVKMPPGYSGRFVACPAVQIDCDCARHVFVWNYALNKNNAAIKDRTNGEPPVITNPEEIPGCCKHGVIALRFLIRSNPKWTPQTKAVSSLESRKPIPLKNLHQSLNQLRYKRKT